MRFLSAILIGLAAISSPSDALRISSSHTASHKLSRLSQRTSTNTLPDSIGYKFNGDLYDLNGSNKGILVPSNAYNLLTLSNNARSNPVLTRHYSPSQLDSRVEIPIGLTSSYSIGVWISWSGTSNASGENDIISSTDAKFRLYLNSDGHICVGYNGACLVTDFNPVPQSVWQHIAVTYDAGTGTMTLYRNGIQISSAISIGYTGSSKLALLNRGIDKSDNGFIGSMDDLRIYTSILTSANVNELYTTTTTGVVIASTDTWIGHFSYSHVSFASRVLSQPTGDIRIQAMINDVDVRANTNVLFIRMWGVKGATVSSLSVPNIGIVTWDSPTMLMTIIPFQPIPKGTEIDYTIPGTVLNLSNPDLSSMLSDSDARWSITVGLEKDQTGGYRQATHWQPITYTPETINPNPTLLEESAFTSLLQLEATSITTDCSSLTSTSTCIGLTESTCATSKQIMNGVTVPCQSLVGGACQAAHQITCQ